MRYNINGTEVRSENAAKPACFAGRWVLDWMSMLDRRASALDLGCGKLRYTVHLSRLLQSVVAVDSKAQIDRVQKLFGLDCSVREYTARYLPNVSAFAFDEPQWRRSQYSVILCSNVLSAIP